MPLEYRIIALIFGSGCLMGLFFGLVGTAVYFTRILESMFPGESHES